MTDEPTILIGDDDASVVWAVRDALTAIAAIACESVHRPQARPGHAPSWHCA